MATCWAKCSDLFLYTKGNDVYLWRWNKTTWMPMKTADFEDLGKVTDYVDLIGGKDSMLEWEKSAYIDLVAYISSRRLLVNSKGLVIAELGFHGQDGEMEKNERPFYIRLLDVLSLKQFGLRDRTVPSRTARYLETKGRVAPVEGSTITTTEKQVAELKAANKTLKRDKEAAEKQVAELTEANKTLKSDKEALKEAAEKEANDLKDRNKSLVKDVEVQKTAAEKAQQERDAAKRDKDAAERKAADLQTQIDDSLAINEKKEVWMNEFSDQHGKWSTFDQLGKEVYSMGFARKQYSNAVLVYDDLTTNVRSSYFYYGRLSNCSVGSPGNWGLDGFKAVRLDDLNPNKERARFTYDWYKGTCKGDMYAIKQHSGSLSPGDSCRLSEKEVKSLNILGKS